MQSPKSAYFPALTGLRAIAAYIVYFHHYPFSKLIFGNWIYNFTAELYIGVTIFFVLSGFLIALRYEDSFQQQDKNFTKYFINRFARIYPLYFLLTTITFIIPLVIDIGHNDISPLSYFLNVTLLKAYSDTYKFTGLSQGWTLTVEETFYLLAPLFFIYRNKIKLWKWVIILYATGFILTLIFSRIDFIGLFANFKFTYITTFFGRCFEFLLGIYLARLYKNRSNNFSFKNIYGARTYSGVIAIILITILLMNVKSPVAEYDYGLYSDIGCIINNLLLPLAVGLFMYGLVIEKTIVSNVLKTKPFLLLGKASYAFYLIHMGYIQDFLLHHVTPTPAITFLILIVISIILFKLVEEPLNKWIKSLYKNRITKTSLST